MSRYPQPTGSRGSLKWIQRATHGHWADLEQPILQAMPGASTIKWLSPIAGDDWAEYRDGAFLERIGLSELTPALGEFWPRHGPQWDALARTDRGDVILVEAKAHVGEMCSPGTGAGAVSRALIASRLDEVATNLGARSNRAAWTAFFYQLANRIAHLSFLRKQGVSAWLVLVNFLNDADMGGPTSPETWKAAYEVAFHVMGLGKRHALARYILEVYPDVSIPRDAS